MGIPLLTLIDFIPPNLLKNFNSAKTSKKNMDSCIPNKNHTLLGYTHPFLPLPQKENMVPLSYTKNSNTIGSYKSVYDKAANTPSKVKDTRILPVFTPSRDTHTISIDKEVESNLIDNTINAAPCNVPTPNELAEADHSASYSSYSSLNPPPELLNA